MEERLAQLEEELATLKREYAIHQHNDIDGTNSLRKNIILDPDQFLGVGNAIHASQQPIANPGLSTEEIRYTISVGKDSGRVGFVNKSNNLDLRILHQPNAATSFITAIRKPAVSPVQGYTVSVTIAGNTVTIDGFNFTTNELTNALINIYNSSGTLIETQTIASNTSNVITISGTWGATTSGGSFIIFLPVYMGAADFPYQRFYTAEGTAGGIRFGVGPTNGGQNGLLYMDATGDLYWRNKAGTATKVYLSASTPLSGTKVYYVSDTSGGAVTRKLTFTNGILTAET